MCSGIFGGGSSPSYEAPKPVRVDPAPTAVQSADVEADTNNNKKKDRRRVSTRLSTDRDSILGGLVSGDNGSRDKLG
jgi:hypothetical protein